MHAYIGVEKCNVMDEHFCLMASDKLVNTIKNGAAIEHNHFSRS